ncbi:HTH domain-containing protein [Halosolutus amylolyticus]|uniref:HTH domain-containing protein n=1 Tax=Halosolutus amylolyticus TaxID=2932267 RepID=A0ABD5PM96_9EURY|nr:HTH domain-containing protein [Halosolutus amylolyticus]
MTAPTSTTETEVTAVCHVRAPLLLEPVDRQVETLQACESEGTVDDLLLRSWPKEVSLSESTPHQEVLETYDRLTGWAERQGVSVEPPFRERTTTSQVTGETKELLVTPLLCLEVYADDELVGVFPHSAADETYTTDEAIASLRTGDLPTPIEGDAHVEGTTSGGCPACDGSVVDGQGLYACPDCGWVGTVSETGQYVSHSKPDESSARRIATPEAPTQ